MRDQSPKGALTAGKLSDSYEMYGQKTGAPQRAPSVQLNRPAHLRLRAPQ